jgi:allantoinase
MITIETFIPMLTSQPASFLMLYKKGKIEIGYDADIVIWDPEKAFTVKKESILHRHKISPYIGEQLWGAVQQTITGGSVVFDHGISLNNFEGKILFNTNYK